jgi:sulfatase modifying factor 1
MQPSRATACTLALGLGLFAVLAPACNSILGNENASFFPEADASAVIDASPPDSPTVFDAGTYSGGLAMAGDAAACPSGKGPDMVNVANLFCIDSTEVTVAEYDRFLAAGITPGSMGEPMPACGFNKAYAPSGENYDPGTPMTYPVTYVNWCDAFAFCAWSGKRLCGAVAGGADGGGTTTAAFATLQNEHYYACSAGGTRMYPYGSTYSKTTCNGSMNHGTGMSAAELPAGVLGTCVGGFMGLFDMVGNVEEWQNGCIITGDAGAGPGDTCLHGTGSFAHGTAACGYVDQDDRDYQYGDVGIRCCASMP